MERLWYREVPLITDARFRQLVYRLNYLMIKALSALHHVDLTCSYQPSRQGLAERWRRFLKNLRSNQPIQQRCMTLAVLIQFCFMVRMAVAQYYQYLYDFDQIKLERLKSSHAEDTETIQNLETRIEQLRETLEGFGAPHREWSMMVEFIHDYLIAISVLNFIIVPVYSGINGGIHFPWLQYCMDRKTEEALQTQLGTKLFNDYTNSIKLCAMSQLSSPIKIDRIQIDLCRLRMRQRMIRSDISIQGDLLRWQRWGAVETSVLLEIHKSKIDQLRRIQAEGYLSTFIDRPDGWLDFLVIMNLLSTICVIVYSCLATIVCHIFIENFYNRLDRHVQINSYKDVMELVYFSYVLTCTILAAVCNFNLSLCAHFDSHRLTKSLKRNLHQAISRNEYLLSKIRLVTISDSQIRTINWDSWRNLGRILPMIEEIETNTVASILCYKYFCAYYQRSKRSLEINSAIIFAYAALAPTLARIHVPYLSDFETRYFIMSAGLAAMVPCLLLCWPNCLIHSRCLELYGGLTGLLAQLISIEFDDSMKNCFNLGHEIALLRKELERPHEISRQFTLKMLGTVAFTFPNLIRLQFGILILAISLLSNLSLIGERIHFLSDPFGVFRE